MLNLLKQNTDATKKLFLIAGIIVIVVLILTAGATGCVAFCASCDRPDFLRGCFGGGDEPEDEPHEDYGEGESEDSSVDLYPDDDDGGLFRPPARTNFLLVGRDLNLLADAVMVGTFYRDTGQVHIMSIPRDTVVRIPPHIIDDMRERGFRPPHTLKLTQLRGHGGRVEGIEFFRAQVEWMLGVEFDYYVEVELAAFRRIVDAIGGVEMYIPRRLFYQDPTANPPTNINVPAGLVMLDGAMAEGVVRFRNYPMGDLTRNEMQMEFMSQLIRQAATRDAIMHNPAELIRIFFEEVSTNAGLEIAFYLPYLQEIDMENVTTFTAPGRLGPVSGFAGDLFHLCPDRLPDVISQIFYADLAELELDPDEEEEPDEEEPEE